jgi:hypothetical protein
MRTLISALTLIAALVKPVSPDIVDNNFGIFIINNGKVIAERWHLKNGVAPVFIQILLFKGEVYECRIYTVDETLVEKNPGFMKISTSCFDNKFHVLSKKKINKS